MEMFDKISSAVNNGEFSVGICIDLSKAFDTINHSILLDKLSYYGIRGIALDWFRSYLHSRQQYGKMSQQNAVGLAEYHSKMPWQNAVPKCYIKML